MSAGTFEVTTCTDKWTCLLAVAPTYQWTAMRTAVNVRSIEREDGNMAAKITGGFVWFQLLTLLALAFMLGRGC